MSGQEGAKLTILFLRLDRVVRMEAKDSRGESLSESPGECLPPGTVGFGKGGGSWRKRLSGSRARIVAVRRPLRCERYESGSREGSEDDSDPPVGRVHRAGGTGGALARESTWACLQAGSGGWS